MNLCTDQLAMLLADQDQLLSVSHLSSDPLVSSMTKEANDYITNYGRAEEIYILNPDLILVSTYTSRATVDMFKRLGLRVEAIQPVTKLEEVKDRILEIGQLLGREAAAKTMANKYMNDLNSVRLDTRNGPRAALYAANGWTSGDYTLAGQILLAAGMRNVAAEAGITYNGTLPLETLAMAQPDLIVGSETYRGHSRSEEILVHPIVKAYQQDKTRSKVHDSDWFCGTPHILNAVSRLATDRQNFQARAE
jgi:iron complex transport system substrate-binding protein